jgi:hypothetical protein
MAGIERIPFEAVDLPFKSYRNMDDVLQGWVFNASNYGDILIGKVESEITRSS